MPTHPFPEKNRRRQAAKGTPFGSLSARTYRRWLGGAFGKAEGITKQHATGEVRVRLGVPSNG